MEETIAMFDGDIERFCYSCMTKYKGNMTVCPHCGKSLILVQDNHQVLRPGTVLHEKYVVGNVLGNGGFGITYIGYDTLMQTRIAIKEFYPSGMVERNTNTGENSVHTVSMSMSDSYKAGLERYVKEVRTLAGVFGIQGVVQVKDFFYENETAYMIMEYIDGISLSQYLEQKGGRLSPEEALHLVMPVMDALEVIHKKGLLHRDISPHNIMVTSEGVLKLIDFGAARYFDNDAENTMTVILKHGYAPIEQYSRADSQGAYSDIYSICATLYKLITGETPIDATQRITGHQMKSISEWGIVIDPQLEGCILKGMAIMAQHRYQSIEELKAAIQNKPVQQAVSSVSPEAVKQAENVPVQPVFEQQVQSDRQQTEAKLYTTDQIPEPQKEKSGNKILFWIITIVGVVIGFSVPLLLPIIVPCLIIWYFKKFSKNSAGRTKDKEHKEKRGIEAKKDKERVRKMGEKRKSEETQEEKISLYIGIFAVIYGGLLLSPMGQQIFLVFWRILGWGMAGLFLALCFIIGMMPAVMGIVFGVKNWKHKEAKAGIGLSVISVIMAIISISKWCEPAFYSFF